MDIIMECCCGLDVHRDLVEACIIKGLLDAPEKIQEQFKTTRQELLRMVNWLTEHQCYYIAMESTGVYWRPIYEVIEEHSPRYDCMMVVNAHHMRNLPGRKSDVKDAEWIATLMRHGLLEPSFVPNRIIRDIREFSRLRKTIVKEKNRHTNHLEKFLQTHGFKLSSVLSDILCVSGRKLLNTLAQTGKLTTDDVLKAVRGKTKYSKEEIAVAVCGSVTTAEQSLLQLLLKRIDDDYAYLTTVEQQMEELFAPFASAIDIVDSIPGIDKITAMTVLSEIGAAPKDSFQTAGHLCSWAGLTPRNDESAGKVKSRKIMPGNQYIKTILCQAAWGSSQGQKFQLCPLVLVTPGAHWTKESDYRSIQKAAENDLHPFGEGAVLRPELCGKSNRINTAPIKFLSRGIAGTCFALF